VVYALNPLLLVLLFFSLPALAFGDGGSQLLLSNSQPAQVQLDGQLLTKGNAFWYTPILWVYPWVSDGYYYSQINETQQISNQEYIVTSNYTRYYANQSFQTLFNTSTHLLYNYVDGIYLIRVDTTLTMNQPMNATWLYVEYGTGNNKTGYPRDIVLNLYENNQEIFSHPTVKNNEHYSYRMNPAKFYVLESRSLDDYPSVGMVLERWKTSNNLSITAVFYDGEVRNTELHMNTVPLSFRQGEQVQLSYYVYFTYQDWRPSSLAQLRSMMYGEKPPSVSFNLSLTMQGLIAVLVVAYLFKKRL
jgi:hypothetical protein